VSLNGSYARSRLSEEYLYGRAMGAAENVELVRIAITEPEAGWDTADEHLVWHFEAKGTELHGEYQGKDNVLANFLMKLFEITGGTFAVEPVDIWPAGDELVAVHYRVSMTIDGAARSGDGVLVYRIIDGLITEVFDIPSSVLL